MFPSSFTLENGRLSAKSAARHLPKANRWYFTCVDVSIFHMRCTISWKDNESRIINYRYRREAIWMWMVLGEIPAKGWFEASCSRQACTESIQVPCLRRLWKGFAVQIFTEHACEQTQFERNSRFQKKSQPIVRKNHFLFCIHLEWIQPSNYSLFPELKQQPT